MHDRRYNLFVQILRETPRAEFVNSPTIRSEYPVEILEAASAFFTVSNARIRQIVGISSSGVGRLKSGSDSFDSAVTECIYRLIAVSQTAIETFENEDAAIVWMRTPNRALGGGAPLDLMDTPVGEASVRQILNAIVSGGVA
jgi:putative toxin-antitoxin system antitoxin component (TIGR02293 family)